MLYKKLTAVALSVYAFLSSPTSGGTYYYTGASAIPQTFHCPSAEPCEIVCDLSDHKQVYNIYCEDATECTLTCEEKKCFSKANIYGGTTPNLIVTLGPRGQECFSDAKVYAPNGGSAYFYNGVAPKGYRKINIFSDNTQEIVLNCDGTAANDECKNMNIDASSAQFFQLSFNGATEAEFEAGTIQCPRDSSYKGPHIAPCMIDAANGILVDVAIDAPDGIPKGVWIPSCSTCDASVTISCATADTLNGAEGGASAWPFDQSSDCWWTNHPTSDPTIDPTIDPTTDPTTDPTHAPSQAPTLAPTRSPTHAPSKAPSHAPSNAPSLPPTDAPSKAPTRAPSDSPTSAPSVPPTRAPSVAPTHAPSRTPSSLPTVAPSRVPSQPPSSAPIQTSPTAATNDPTAVPTLSPVTPLPTASPSQPPSKYPTAIPTITPSYDPTMTPSHLPSVVPTAIPSVYPTRVPTRVPSQYPTMLPSHIPTSPSEKPTTMPTKFGDTRYPSTTPTAYPTQTPSALPTQYPSHLPSVSPTAMPSVYPTPVPTRVPSEYPTMVPSDLPTSVSEMPTTAPTQFTATTYPSATPTSAPIQYPSNAPTAQGIIAMIRHPSVSPSKTPGHIPTADTVTQSTSDLSSRRTNKDSIVQRIKGVGGELWTVVLIIGSSLVMMMICCAVAISLYIRKSVEKKVELALSVSDGFKNVERGLKRDRNHLKSCSSTYKIREYADKTGVAPFPLNEEDVIRGHQIVLSQSFKPRGSPRSPVSSTPPTSPVSVVEPVSSKVELQRVTSSLNDVTSPDLPDSPNENELDSIDDEADVIDVGRASNTEEYILNYLTAFDVFTPGDGDKVFDDIKVNDTETVVTEPDAPKKPTVVQSRWVMMEEYKEAVRKGSDYEHKPYKSVGINAIKRNVVRRISNKFEQELVLDDSEDEEEDGSIGRQLAQINENEADKELNEEIEEKPPLILADYKTDEYFEHQHRDSGSMMDISEMRDRGSTLGLDDESMVVSLNQDGSAVDPRSPPRLTIKRQTTESFHNKLSSDVIRSSYIMDCVLNEIGTMK